MSGTPTAVRIVVPGSPDPILAPNRRAHGLRKAAATAQHRADAKYAALSSAMDRLPIPAFAGPVAVSILVRWGKGHRRHDLDSTAVMTKPFCDGLTDAKIWSDDRQIARLTIEQERDETGRGEVVIEVREIA